MGNVNRGGPSWKRSQVGLDYYLYTLIASEWASSTYSQKIVMGCSVCSQEFGTSNHDLNFVHAFTPFLASLVPASISMTGGL